MKNNRFINSYGLSGVFALLGFGICMLNYDVTADTPEGCIIWVAELFAICLTMGLLGLEAEIFLRRKRFVPTVKRSIVKKVICAALIGAMLGAAGQALYALEINVERKTEKDNTKTKETHIVLLMDYSGSMMNSIEDEKEVTCRLIEELDESTSLQVIAFSDTVENRAVSDFMPMTESNKDALQSFVRGIDIWFGGTNFDLPLEKAYETLYANKKSDCRSAVVMLSDYEKYGYTLITDIGDRIKGEGFEIYSVRLASQGSQPDANDLFMQYADEDFAVAKNSDGSFDTEELLKALTQSVKGKSKGGISDVSAQLGEEILTAEAEPEAGKIIIRIIVYGIFSMAAGYVYYGYESGMKLLLNFAVGAVPGVASLINPVFGYILLMLAGAGSFTRFEIEEERNYVR